MRLYSEILVAVLLLSAVCVAGQDTKVPTPVLSQMTPTSGEPGTTLVTITGEKFSEKMGNSVVQFAGVTAEVRQWRDTSITVQVPATAKPGMAEVLVRIDGQKEDYPGKFAVVRFSPSQGAEGQVVEIHGSGFGNTRGGKVYFGKEEATVRRWTDTAIIVVAPGPAPKAATGLSVTVRLSTNKTLQEGTFTLMPASAATPPTAATTAVAATPAEPATTTTPTTASTTTPAPTATAQIAKLSLDKNAGIAGTEVKITGKGIPALKSGYAVEFGNVKVTASAWEDSGVVATVPDLELGGKNLPVPVQLVDSKGNELADAGTFTEYTQVATLDKTEGKANDTVTITGNVPPLPESQGAAGVLFDKTPAQVSNWDKSGTIKATVPDLKKISATKVAVTVVDGSGKTLANAGTYTVDPNLSVTPSAGYAGTALTISGDKIPQTQGSNLVKFYDDAHPEGVTGSVNNWTGGTISVTAPDFHPKTDDKTGDTVTVDVIDAQGASLLQTKGRFKEVQARWGDGDDAIKFVGGFEQGFQSAQAGDSDAFLAIYGRRLFSITRKAGDKRVPMGKLGPAYSIRLQTAPQTVGTYNVTSMFSTPTGSSVTQGVQSVGQAVNFSLGFDYQLPQTKLNGQATLSIIGGAGFVTPLQSNTVNATYAMPGFGTVECTELQRRLRNVLLQDSYAGITANKASGSSSCFTNNIGVASGGTGTAITQLEYSAPDQPNFYPKYFLGVRAVTRYAGSTGLPVCDSDNPCERGYVDLTLGQNASVSGGTLKHLIFGVDSIYPLRVPNVNFLYLFGSVAKRLHNLPPVESPLVLQAGTVNTMGTPNPAYLLIPMTQPDRDFYRIGIGVNLCNLITALSDSKLPCRF